MIAKVVKVIEKNSREKLYEIQDEKGNLYCKTSKKIRSITAQNYPKTGLTLNLVLFLQQREIFFVRSYHRPMQKRQVIQRAAIVKYPSFSILIAQHRILSLRLYILCDFHVHRIL